jgi:hypothetical protein
MSAYKVGDERNCRSCQQPVYFGGAAWWHKHNESTFCEKTGFRVDKAEPDLDEVERVRVHAPELLEALRMMVATGEPVGSYGNAAYIAAKAAIARAEGK